MEAGVAEEEQQVQRDYAPTDFIELSKDFFQPSVTYSKYFGAVQKDLVLGNLSEMDTKQIELRFGNIEDAALLIAKNKARWGYLKTTMDYYLAWIALRVSMGRGRNSETARLMRSTFSEHKATMGELEGMQKRREGALGKAKRWVGI